MSILEVLRLSGRGAHAQFKFGNRKPGSTKPLLFEFTEKHLQDCDTKIEDLKTKSKDSKNGDHRSGIFRREPNLTLRRSFLARNTGELPIDVYKFYINGLMCEGYGFKVLNCEPFTLQPNDSRKIEIAFTPDFTLSRIERDLKIETSMGPTPYNYGDEEEEEKGEKEEKVDAEFVSTVIDGVVKLNLLTALPTNKLEKCAKILTRPNWEDMLQYTAIVVVGVLFLGALVSAFLEADRILSILLLNMSRGNPTQPPLDLRLLSHSSPIQQQHENQADNHHQQQSKEKLANVSDDNNSRASNKSSNKKDESPSSSSIWNFLSGKRSKDKDKSSFKQHEALADWPADEERRFRLDSEARDGLKRCVDSASLSLEPTQTSSGGGGGGGGGGSKKRSGKQQQRHSSQDAPPADSVVADATAAAEMQLASSEKKSSTKSSPTSNRKQGKAYKDEATAKVLDHEVQVDVGSSSVASVKDAVKQETTSKRKQSANISSSTSSHNTYRKYEANASQKVTQYSEEETSSTTTESSIQDDSNTYKDCENSGEKSDKAQRKSTTKKSKSQSNSDVPSLDYKDNYEGDCDDDDYDKDKQDNPNRWKTSTPRASSKTTGHQLSRSGVSETASKLPRQKQAPSKKEKASQKRRNTEKSQSKAVTTATTATTTTTTTITTPVVAVGGTHGITTTPREESTRPPVVIPATISPPPILQTSPVPQQQPQPAPPPAVRWGENRAKFSDVVARNQDNSSPFSNQSGNTNPNKSHETSTHSIPGIFNFLDSSDSSTKHPLVQEPSPNDYQFGLKTTDKDDLPVNVPNILGIPSNSYFVNTFSEPTYEQKLVPYDDLPDTEEPLTELENVEENPHSKFWQDNNPIVSSITDSSIFPINPRQSTASVSDLSDSLKDNWAAAETNWESTYSAAVGEERIGVWGTSGVWAAGPWGAQPPPPSLPPTTLAQTNEPSAQENLDFDPFRSLSTIWTPSSTDIWATINKNDHVDDTH